jgi:hypothetical protein
VCTIRFHLVDLAHDSRDPEQFLHSNAKSPLGSWCGQMRRLGCPFHFSEKQTSAYLALSALVRYKQQERRGDEHEATALLQLHEGGAMPLPGLYRAGA